MIFNTFSYYVLFLLPTAMLWRWLPARPRAIALACSGASFFVYFSYTAFGGLPAAFCLAIFLWEAAFSRFYRPASPVCVLGIVQAVLILGAFKYWNFVISFLPQPWAAAARWDVAFLPLGISFFTFEFIHYAVDRLRGKAERGNFWEYLAFILFFPTMVAGPIKRIQDFAPKLHERQIEWATDWHVGITRILVGLAKKFAIADLLTALTDNLVEDSISSASRGALLLWIFAYGIKIYVDFSAYSDIAIGSARLIGVRVPENFDWPYLQRNIADFWKHWHMSLTRWLTEYVFIPLGGSRCPLPRVLLNVLVTMLVSGLWHGAGLNFLVWGAWHGILLATHRLFRRISPAPVRPSRIGTIASWGATFASVNLGWVFFCMDLPTAWLFFQRLLLQ